MTQETLRYGTVLLDFHGTFTNNRGRLAHALNQAYIRNLGRFITPAEFKGVLDRPEGITVQDRLFQMINGSLAPNKKRALIDDFKTNNDRIYIPKYCYLIPKLRSQGAVLAIVTNGNEAVVKGLMEQWGLTSDIEETYGRGPGSHLERGPKKPNPQVIDSVIENLRSRGHTVRRDRTLMLGDYRDDIGAGNSAGVHTAFIVTGPNQLPEYYDARPTYALMDTPNRELTSEWLKQENVFHMRDLPKIVAGKL